MIFAQHRPFVSSSWLAPVTRSAPGSRQLLDKESLHLTHPCDALAMVTAGVSNFKDSAPKFLNSQVQARAAADRRVHRGGEPHEGHEGHPNHPPQGYLGIFPCLPFQAGAQVPYGGMEQHYL